MELDWGPPGSTSRSYETNVAELRDPQHSYFTNSTTTPLRGGQTAAAAAGSGATSGNLLAGVWMLVVALSCLLSSPRTPDDARHRRGRQIREEARRRRQLREEQQKRHSQVSDPSLRQKMVEASLQVQRVTTSQGAVLTLSPVERGSDIEHGAVGEGSKPLHQRADKSADDGEDDDNDANETSICAICLEPFEVGHIVAWSRSKGPLHDPECSHVFHRCVCRFRISLSTSETMGWVCSRIALLFLMQRDCIFPWLQDTSHDDCPSCRVVLFNYKNDEKSVSGGIHLASADGDDEHSCGEDGDCREGAGSAADSDPSSGSLFVIIHGLVAQARQVSYNVIVPPPPDDESDEANISHVNPDPTTDDHEATVISPALEAMVPAMQGTGSFRGGLLGDGTFRRRVVPAVKTRPPRSGLGDGVFKRRPVPFTATSMRDIVFEFSGSSGGGAAGESSHDAPLDKRKPHALRRVVSAGPGSPLRRDSDTENAAPRPVSHRFPSRPSLAEPTPEAHFSYDHFANEADASDRSEDDVDVLTLPWTLSSCSSIDDSSGGDRI
jgi:hypothetical protein